MEEEPIGQIKIIKCIKIVHPVEEVHMYREMAGFFRFVGIFACENMTGEEYGDEVDWEYLIEKDPEEEDSEVIKNCILEKLEELEGLCGIENVEILKRIEEIFHRHSLMRKSYAMEYFGDSGEKYIYEQMMEAHGEFEKALSDLEKYEKECENNVLGQIYIWAAEATCKRRMNEIYVIVWNAIQMGSYGENSEEKDKNKQKLWKKQFYEYEEINKDIMKILEVDPQFYAAYVIRGFSMEVDEEYKIDAARDIKRAIQIIGEKSYNNYLYYRLGRYCEMIRPNLLMKMEYYKKAHSADAHNYRAVYKLAADAQENGKSQEAIDIWEKLLGILEIKREFPSLQPIESAYLYKTYCNLGKLYIGLKEHKKGIEYLEKAVGVYENTKDEEPQKGFYPWMFLRDIVEPEKGKRMERWQIYKRAVRKKMRVKKIYTSIVNASLSGNLPEEYKKYSEKLQELESEID